MRCTYRQQNVSIEGEVLFAGTYTIPKRNARLSDLVKAAGGANDIAYIKGARLIRKANEAERTRMEQVLKMAREQQQKNLMQMASSGNNSAALTQLAQENKNNDLEKFNITGSYPIGIYLDKAMKNPGGEDDIILREGDRLIIPQYNGTVKINGAVMHANTVGYVKGRKVGYYVDQAGGFSRDAKKRDTYIIYMNGTIARVSHDAKVEPGCEIFVPSKVMTKMTMAEKLAMGSGFASIATMIATIGNLLK